MNPSFREFDQAHFGGPFLLGEWCIKICSSGAIKVSWLEKNGGDERELTADHIKNTLVVKATQGISMEDKF